MFFEVSQGDKIHCCIFNLSNVWKTVSSFFYRGARHGLKLNGKLQRLEEQEKRLADECSVKSVEIGGELPNERVSSKETDGNSVGKHESDQNAELVVDAGCTSKVKKRKLLNKST